MRSVPRSSMEALINHTKRKKRKTRKCLNEIRKRSRKNSMVNELNGESLKTETNVTKVNLKIVKSVNNNCITSNRLTLAMFPKAVRSETITRPALTEIQNKNKLFSDMQISMLNKEIPEVNPEHSKILESTGNTNSNSDDGSINADQVNDLESSPLSFISKNDDLNQQNNLSPVTVTMSTTSTPTFDITAQPPPGYRLYQQFMEDLPTYVIEKAPTLVKDDVIKKTKTFLQHLYVDRCRQTINNTALNCMNNATTLNKVCFDRREPFEHSSINYIRYGKAWQQEVLNSITNFKSENRLAETSSPESVSSTHSSTSPLNSDTPLKLSIIHDTPEYNYYPHKLN